MRAGSRASSWAAGDRRAGRLPDQNATGDLGMASADPMAVHFFDRFEFNAQRSTVDAPLTLKFCSRCRLAKNPLRRMSRHTLRGRGRPWLAGKRPLAHRPTSDLGPPSGSTPIERRRET